VDIKALVEEILAALNLLHNFLKHISSQLLVILFLSERREGISVILDHVIVWGHVPADFDELAKSNEQHKGRNQ
jgi:hypothetical protein